jgi:hypothetical protein
MIGYQHVKLWCGKLWFSSSSTMTHNGFSMDDALVCVLSALSHNTKFIG